MYIQRAKYNNRYINGVFPSIRIESPQAGQKIAKNDLKLIIMTRACRLGYQNYYYKIYINNEDYKNEFYTDGEISLDSVSVGHVSLKVELYYGNNLVNEDSIDFVVYDSETKSHSGVKVPCDPVSSESSYEDDGPCDPVSSSSYSKSSSSSSSSHEVDDGPNGPCEPVTSSSYSSTSTSSSSSSYEDDEVGPCDPITYSDDASELPKSPRSNKCKLVLSKGVPGPRGPPGPSGDGGLIKSIYNSTQLASGVRTYVVKESEYRNIILTLPQADYSKNYNGIYNGDVVTIYNDTLEGVLIQVAPGYGMKGVDGYYVLQSNMSMTFHNLKSTWYPISK